MTFNDPYFWMEAGGPAFEVWMSAQADYARRCSTPFPDMLRCLRTCVTSIAGETYGGAVCERQLWVYSKLRPNRFVRQDSSSVRITGGAERVLIDAREFDTGGLTAHIDYWSVAPDGRHIAYGISLGGSETGTLHDRSIESGADLPDQIDRTRYITPSWIDNASFLYTRFRSRPPAKPNP